MCGITGIWHLNGEKLELKKLKRFTDSLTHRGPDGGGYKIFDDVNLGLGHRRLSILDLSEQGAQPMSYADERYWLSYNGEVYNFIELRKELKKLGYKFRSNSDSEVMIAAYVHWGKECLLKFNGMWAAAIYDKNENSLFLSRDRFGIKPLYYCYIPDVFFAFASETYAFRFLDGFIRTIHDLNLLRSIFNSNLLEAHGYTLFNRIFQILPGHYLNSTPGKEIRQVRWWNTFDHLTSVSEKYEEQVEQFRELFEKACSIRMRSDVSIASALSGGLDSSSVYCTLHHSMKKSPNMERTPANWQRAYVNTFPGTSLDEKKFAAKVIEHTKGEVRYIEPDYANLVKNISDSTFKFDAITGTPICVVSDVYRTMRKDNIVVSLDGHGMDEMMYGYTSSVANALIDAANSEPENLTWVNDMSDIYIRLFDEHRHAEIKQRIKDTLQRVRKFKEEQKNSNPKLKWMKNTLRAFFDKNTTSFAIEKMKTNDWFNAMEIKALRHITDSPYSYNCRGLGELQLAKEFHDTSLPYNLRDFDRGSMQSGVEIRMPFMDWRLVVYILSLPQNSKIGQGFTKRILRDAMIGILPEQIRQRKLKIGLQAPLQEWFNGPLAEFLTDSVTSSGFEKIPFINTGIVRRFVENRVKNNSWNQSDSKQFWTLLNAYIILND